MDVKYLYWLKANKGWHQWILFQEWLWQRKKNGFFTLLPSWNTIFIFLPVGYWVKGPLFCRAENVITQKNFLKNQEKGDKCVTDTKNSIKYENKSEALHYRGSLLHFFHGHHTALTLLLLNPAEHRMHHCTATCTRVLNVERIPEKLEEHFSVEE